ncbi:hypothetical protein [Candidatus Magnetaquicoccus inordinatus]|uniref:hypothetical protein n=1 Tax=Candidatus Magnetaquicoccus inordinatus TaxID=2496818 RepID=UPI00102B22D3|nr:hypothetical protein [Candidatus Magnetaquicoccus inordinatus]
MANLGTQIFHAEWNELLKAGKIEELLAHMWKVALHCSIYSPQYRGSYLYLREMDLFLHAVGQLLSRALPNTQITDPGDLFLYAATAIYEVGGHTRVLEDVVKSFPEYQHVLLLTDMKTIPDLLVERFRELNITVIIVEGGSYINKIVQLKNLIAKYQPKCLFNFAHPYDVIVNSALTGYQVPVLFDHFANNLPCLGATRADFLHIDHSETCFHYCQKNSGVTPHWIRLTAEDHGAALLPAAAEALTCVTCAGDPSKYVGVVEFSYPQLLAALFKAGVSLCYHVGPLPEHVRDSFKNKIAALGEDPDKFQAVGPVASLNELLHRLKPDFYFDSHPVTGGKTIIEALSAGIPILLPRPRTGSQFLNRDLTFGAAITIHDLQDIDAALSRFRKEKDILARASRQIYERYYSLQMLRNEYLSILGLAS